MLKKIIVLSVFGALLGGVGSLGCSSAGAETEPGRDLVVPEEAKAYHTGWGYRGDLSCGAVGEGSVSYRNPGHVYGFEATAARGTTVTLDGEWQWWMGAVMFITDERGAVVDWTYDSRSADISLAFSAPVSGRYYAFVAPMRLQGLRAGGDYTLGLDCAGCASDAECGFAERCDRPVCVTTPCDFVGECVPQPTCAEIVTSDGRIYAKNFPAGQAEEARAWVEREPARVESGVNVGTCQDANRKGCTKEYAPVCGAPGADQPRTYGNRCMLQSEVRAIAGSSGEYKGRFEPGECGTFCAVASFEELGRTYVYANNVESHVAGTNWLEQTFPNAAHEVLEGACDEPRPCTQEYAPVCGDLAGVTNTYPNACAFRDAVRVGAGGDGQNKGFSTSGACSDTCTWDEPGLSYVGYSPSECAVIKFVCAANTTFFSNECGCGCAAL